MEPERKTKRARIVAGLSFAVAILLLLDDIFFDTLSESTLVPLASLFIMIALLALASAKKEEEKRATEPEKTEE